MLKLIKRIQRMLFKRKFEQLKKELEQLEEVDGCLKISCKRCRYLRRVNDHLWTCKREEIVNKMRRFR